jgi:thioesterase domain-containing protein
MSLADLQEKASTLNERDRATFALWLLDSLPPHSNEDATEEGLREAVSRRKQLDTGEVQPMSSDQFWASIERERASWK